MSSLRPKEAGAMDGTSTEVAGEVPCRASSPLSEAGCEGFDCGEGEEPGELDETCRRRPSSPSSWCGIGELEELGGAIWTARARAGSSTSAMLLAGTCAQTRLLLYETRYSVCVCADRNKVEADATGGDHVPYRHVPFPSCGKSRSKARERLLASVFTARSKAE